MLLLFFVHRGIYKANCLLRRHVYLIIMKLNSLWGREKVDGGKEK